MQSWASVGVGFLLGLCYTWIIGTATATPRLRPAPPAQVSHVIACGWSNKRKHIFYSVYNWQLKSDIMWLNIELVLTFTVSTGNTHTHTHSHTHTHTHTHTSAHIYTHSHSHTHTNSHCLSALHACTVDQDSPSFSGQSDF